MPHKQRGEEMFWLLTLPPHVSWPWRRRGKYKYMRQMRNTKWFQDEKYPGLVWGITKWVWDATHLALVCSKVQNQVRNAWLMPKETQSGFEMRNTHLLYEDIQSVFKIWNTRLSPEQIQIGFEIRNTWPLSKEIQNGFEMRNSLLLSEWQGMTLELEGRHLHWNAPGTIVHINT